MFGTKSANSSKLGVFYIILTIIFSIHTIIIREADGQERAENKLAFGAEKPIEPKKRYWFQTNEDINKNKQLQQSNALLLTKKLFDDKHYREKLLNITNEVIKTLNLRPSTRLTDQEVDIISNQYLHDIWACLGRMLYNFIARDNNAADLVDACAKLNNNSDRSLSLFKYNKNNDLCIPTWTVHNQGGHSKKLSRDNKKKNLENALLKREKLLMANTDDISITTDDYNTEYDYTAI